MVRGAGAIILFWVDSYRTDVALRSAFAVPKKWVRDLCSAVPTFIYKSDDGDDDDDNNNNNNNNNNNTTVS